MYNTEHEFPSTSEAHAFFWIHSLASVTFDLDLGQVINWSYGHRLTCAQISKLFVPRYS